MPERRLERADSHIREGARRPIESSSANKCSPTKRAAAASAAARGAHATGAYRVSRRPDRPLAQEPCDLVYRELLRRAAPRGGVIRS
eukprot:scaffold23337_cov64-Phaeocystis_antarctica.AAC.1